MACPPDRGPATQTRRLEGHKPQTLNPSTTVMKIMKVFGTFTTIAALFVALLALAGCESSDSSSSSHEAPTHSGHQH